MSRMVVNKFYKNNWFLLSTVYRMKVLSSLKEIIQEGFIPRHLLRYTNSGTINFKPLKYLTDSMFIKFLNNK